MFSTVKLLHVTECKSHAAELIVSNQSLRFIRQRCGGHVGLLEEKRSKYNRCKLLHFSVLHRKTVRCASWDCILSKQYHRK
jgi:hypothetical protein